MSNKFDDMDFNEISGGVETVQEKDNYYKEMVVVSENELQMTQETIEWEDCITRLEKHCYKSWICIPHTSKDISGNPKLLLEIHETSKCTDEKFFKWLNIVWPPSKDMKHKAGDYSTDSNKSTAINSVVGLHQLVHFPMDKQ